MREALTELGEFVAGLLALAALAVGGVLYVAYLALVCAAVVLVAGGLLGLLLIGWRAL